MNKYYLKTALCLPFFLNLYIGEGYGQEASKKDSLVKIHGITYDIQTKQPIKAVLKYQMIPFQSSVGIVASEGETGEYFLFMIQENKYNLEVSAEGYLSQAEQFTVHDINNDGLVQKNFELVPITEGRVMKLNKLFFVQSKAEITEDSYPQLDILVQMLKDYPSMVIQLEGHTDYRGSAKLNRILSEERVNEVKEYLINKGIKRRRVKTKAFGGTKPITTAATEEAQSRNRRVEVRILKN